MVPTRLLAAAALTAALTAGSLPGDSATAQPLARPKRPLTVSVLSDRADLVSGHDVLVSFRVPRTTPLQAVSLTVGTRDESRRMHRVGATTRVLALLTRVPLGQQTITVRTPRRAGRAVVTMHPRRGPVFAGPQPAPYQCPAGPGSRTCNGPATYHYFYVSSDPTKAGLQPYDPANPPSDVASTTTDQGTTVPFVVRREDGWMDRDRYSILTLFRPGKRWTAWRPQAQWNHKLLITHGGGCGASYTPGEPRLDDYSGTIPASPGITPSYETALGRGFAVLSTALDNTGHNCNLAVEAESLLMAKERLVERYGLLRYTIGTGCSGGSVAQHTIANAYPGIYDGLVTTCSYPDVLSAGAQFADYHLMRLYFEDPSRWATGVAWTEPQMAAVEGHLSVANSITADEGLFKSAINPEYPCAGTKDPVAADRSTRFDSQINPGGVRCSILDLAVNLLGPRPASAWSTWEQRAGHGFAGIPFANAGVLYGLAELRSGLITPEMFVDLNEKVGGLDINADPTPGRIAGDPGAVADAYRTGLLNEFTHADAVPMINHGGPDPGAAHDYAHAFWTELRLARITGPSTPNRVMWFGPTPLIGDPTWANEAFLDMDRWLHAVEHDHRAVPLTTKVAQDRPGDITDRCGAPGMTTTPAGCSGPAVTDLSTPRQEAGGPQANDVLACTLAPLRQSDFSNLSVPFTPDQWSRLQAVFPRGVCDWTAPGLGQQPNHSWLTYGTATRAAYGGTDLTPPPAHSGAGWSAGPFRSLLRQ